MQQKLFDVEMVDCVLEQVSNICLSCHVPTDTRVTIRSGDGRRAKDSGGQAGHLEHIHQLVSSV